MATVSKKTAGTKKVSAAKVNEPVKASVVKKVLAALSRAIPKFDGKDGWGLAPGIVRLNPLPVGYRIGSRFQMLKNEENRVGGKKSVFKGTAKAPTRSGTYVQAIKRAKKKS